MLSCASTNVEALVYLAEYTVRTRHRLIEYGILANVSIDYTRPWHPRSYPASAIACRVCARKFQAGHVPAGDPLCAECATEAAEAQPGLFDAPDRSGGAGLL